MRLETADGGDCRQDDVLTESTGKVSVGLRDGCGLFYLEEGHILVEGCMSRGKGIQGDDAHGVVHR